MDALKKVSKQNDSLAKLSTPFDIKPAAADNDRYFNNPDTIKGERNKQWLTSLQKDLYVDETVDILKDMVTSANSNVVMH